LGLYEPVRQEKCKAVLARCGSQKKLVEDSLRRQNRPIPTRLFQPLPVHSLLKLPGEGSCTTEYHESFAGRHSTEMALTQALRSICGGCCHMQRQRPKKLLLGNDVIPLAKKFVIDEAELFIFGGARG